MSTVNLMTADEDTRQIVLMHAAGESFEVRGGVPKLTGREVLPEWAYAELATLAGVKDGRVSIPTGAEHAALVRLAKQQTAAEQQALATNPYRKGPTFNLTRQIELNRDNPALAEKLKQAAAG